MKKLEQLYEGKAKKVFATEDPDVVIVDYKDDATAFNGLKKGTIQGKGVINNRMSNRVFQLLEKEGIPAYVASRTGYFQAVEIKTLLQLLHVIDNPYQDIPLYGTMESFFGGFSREEIAEIRAGAVPGGHSGGTGTGSL